MMKKDLSRIFLLVCVLAGMSCHKNGPTEPGSTETPSVSGSYAQVGVVQGPADAIASIAISPDGKTIAFGTFADNSVRLVDVATRQVTRTMSGHTNRVTALAFSPDSRTLASTGTVNLTPTDGSVRTWDVTAGAQIASVATSGTSQLAFTPSGSMLAGASGGDPLGVRLWSVNALSLQRTISGVFRIVAFSPDGSRLVAAARDERVYVMDVATGAQVTTFTGHTGWVTAAAFSSNGLVLASAGDDQTIRLWNAQTGVLTRTIAALTTYSEFIALNADGTVLASVGSGCTMKRSGSSIYFTISDVDRFPRMWNMTTGEELTRIDIGSDVVTEAAFSSDWKLFVTGNKSGLIRIFQK